MRRMQSPPDTRQRPNAVEGVWKLSLEERRDKTKVAQAFDKKGVGKEIRRVTALLYDPPFRDGLGRHEAVP